MVEAFRGSGFEAASSWGLGPAGTPISQEFGDDADEVQGVRSGVRGSDVGQQGKGDESPGAQPQGGLGAVQLVKWRLLWESRLWKAESRIGGTGTEVRRESQGTFRGQRKSSGAPRIHDRQKNVCLAPSGASLVCICAFQGVALKC